MTLVDPDRDRRELVALQLDGVGADIRGVADPSDAPQGSEADERIVVVNYDALDGAQRRALEMLLSDGGGERCVLCAAGATQRELGDLCERFGLANIVGAGGASESGELRVTVRKLLVGEIFGLRQYLPGATDINERWLLDSERRDDVVERIERFALTAGASRRLAKVFAVATDELVTNGLYNAPTTDRGEPRNAHLDRKTRVSLDDDRGLRVQWAVDGTRIGVGVTDPFGSLRVDQVRQRVATYLRAEKRRHREGTGGAGLGLYQAFSGVSQFVCNIRTGRKTEVIGTMDVSGTFRDFAARPKSFHVFVDQTEKGRSPWSRAT